MSIALMSLAWRLDIPTTEKMVLLALADAANDAGVTWIAVRSKDAEKMDLLKKCSLSERALQGAIKRLVEGGHLTRKEKPGKGVDYVVHPGKTPAANAPRSKCAPQQTTETPAADAGKTSTTVIVQEATLPSLADAQEAVFKFIASLCIKPRKAKPVLPAWVPAEAWAGFVDMRRKARKPMTDRAMALTIKKLEALAAEGHDPGAVLDQSTMNNWQGIFPLKEQNNGNGNMGRNGSPATGQYRASPGLEWAKRQFALGDDTGTVEAYAGP